MTIDQKMILAVQNLIAGQGLGCVVSRADLLHLLHEKYQVAAGSVIPSDYCYNRINDGIALKKPTLFEFLGGGQYRCLGEGYPYNGKIYHKDQVVGECKNGHRNVFGVTEEERVKAHMDSKTSMRRDPSTRLRFEVLARDRFTCRFCGASPTKDPEVSLHIDHIIPWSKGGKTTLENLQTLCSKCNLGKSDTLVE